MSAVVSSSTSECVNNSNIRLRSIFQSRETAGVSSPTRHNNTTNNNRNNNNNTGRIFQRQNSRRGISNNRENVEKTDNNSALNTGTIATAPALSGSITSVNSASLKQCFHWCCCCRCSCSLLRSGVQDSEKEDPSQEEIQMQLFKEEPTASLEEIRNWGESFDCLLRSDCGRKIFHEFLKKEFSDENILFWLAVEELKKETDSAVIEERARFIFEDYVSIFSPKEVSLDSKVRELINESMVEPCATMFDEAQSQIYTLMHRDSYPRFINSQMYKDLVNPPDQQSTTQSQSPNSTSPTTAGSSTKQTRSASITRKKEHLQ